MPKYDYRCAGGHTTEAVRPVEVGLIDCSTCEEPAQRLAVYDVQVMGDGINCHRPTREARININQLTEAHGEVLHEAKKKGVQAPDFLKIAKERVRTGAVKAYE
jgi:hypothetical protein